MAGFMEMYLMKVLQNKDHILVEQENKCLYVYICLHIYI